MTESSDNADDGLDPGTGSADARRLYVSLDSLFLDPNNFRFIDNPLYRKIEGDGLFDDDVQRRTTGFILGRNQSAVRDLLDSITVNGWLEVDPILVQKKSRGRYLVIEGNRRVATLKHLKRRHEEDAIDLGKLDRQIFDKVPVVRYADADDTHYYIMAGLHHISGKKRWPAINRARLMKQLVDSHDLGPDEVCKALGIHKREFNLSVRTLALCKIYQDSDFGDQFASEAFNLFREVLKSPSIRQWIGWDHQESTATNQANLERLFSWMSREPEIEDEEDPTDSSTSLEPVITTGGHVRELAKIVDDPQAIKRLEQTRSLQEATLSSSLLVRNEIDEAFSRSEREIDKLSQRAAQLGADHLDRIEILQGKLQGISLGHKRRPLHFGGERAWGAFNDIPSNHFTTLRVEEYRGLHAVEIRELRKINIFAGINNAGKTSVLEAIYLLTHQHDERAILEVVRRRGIASESPRYFVDQIPHGIEVSGCFDGKKTRVQLDRSHEPEELENQAFYLASIDIEASHAGIQQSSQTIFFEETERRTTFHSAPQGDRWLCSSVLSSPFSRNDPQVLIRSNEASVSAGTKKRLIQFIREHLDHGLRNIELVNDRQFLVDHESFQNAPSLENFGQGMQQIFRTGLLFANARGGVVLIDEFDNAIHASLLRPFAHLLESLAELLNIQVFVTTHSKEAISAFLSQDDRAHHTSGYALSREGDIVKALHYPGERLAQLGDLVDFDLRSV